MEYVHAIGHMALIWFLVVTLPGPNFVVVTHVTIARSRKLGHCIALGVSLGAGIWATASLLGLSILFQYATWLYTALKIVGGIYLIYMGLTNIWNALQPPDAVRENDHLTASGQSAFRKGLLTSLSNPKTAAFFTSLFLSAFPPQAPIWYQVTAVLVIVLVSLFWYWLVACVFSFDPVRRIFQRIRRALDMATGCLLTFLGLRLIVAKN